MPQIKEYTPQQSLGNDYQTAQASPEAMSAPGRGVQQFGAAVADAGNSIFATAIKQQEMKEVTEGSTKVAMFAADQTNKMKRLSEEGTFNSDKFLDEYQSESDKLMEGFSTTAGNNYMKKSLGDYRAHFQQHAFATQSEQSAVKTREQAKKKITLNSSTLMMNPSAYPAMVKDLDNYVNHLVAPEKLKAAIRNEGRKDLAFGAIRGQMGIDPDGAKVALEKGFWNNVLDTDEIKRMEGEINETIRAKEVDAARNERLFEKAKKAKQEENYNAVISAILVDDPSVTAESISKLDLSAEMKKSAFNFMTTDNKKEATAAANERFAEFADRARLPDGDPNKIYGMADLGNLSEKEFPLRLRLQLTKVIQQMDSPEGRELKRAEDKFIQFAKERIAGKDELGKMKDPTGYAKYAEFLPEYARIRTELRKQGIPLSEMFKSPAESKHSLYSLVDQYTSTFQEKINRNIENMNKTRAPRPVNPDGKPMSAAEILRNATRPVSATTQVVPPTTPPEPPAPVGPPEPAPEPEPEAWNTEVIPDSDASAAVKEFEGFRDKAYQDEAGVWTIGYGTTKNPDGSKVKEGDTITEPEAAKRMKSHLKEDADLVDKAVTRELSSKQRVAIHSLVYNIGFDKFKDSTLLKKLNDPKADLEDIANEFLKWNRIGDKVDQGLTTRREKERKLFLSSNEGKTKKVG